MPGTKPTGLDDLDVRIQSREKEKTDGYVFPSFTTTQRNALTGNTAGRTIFNSTTGKLNFWNGAAWEAVTSA